MVQKGLTRQKFEPTLLRFIGNTISVVLNITLVVAILGYFGVQTTSFAALLAGAGLAMEQHGAASWRTSLRAYSWWFAAIQGRRLHFRGGGITGTVEEVGTVRDHHRHSRQRPDFVGNNKLFADNIQNYTANPIAA